MLEYTRSVKFEDSLRPRHRPMHAPLPDIQIRISELFGFWNLLSYHQPKLTRQGKGMVEASGLCVIGVKHMGISLKENLAQLPAEKLLLRLR